MVKMATCVVAAAAKEEHCYKEQNAKNCQEQCLVLSHRQL